MGPSTVKKTFACTLTELYRSIPGPSCVLRLKPHEIYRFISTSCPTSGSPLQGLFHIASLKYLGKAGG